MRSILILTLVIVAVVAVPEPPRRRFNFRAFARQEVEENGNEKPQGYDYSPPAEAEQLKLPAHFIINKFARQEQEVEEPTNNGNGYSYPKPTYGLPSEPTEQPTTEYGPPTEEPSTEESTDQPTPATDSEIERLKSIKATQLRFRKGQFSSPQKLVRAKVIQQQQLVHVQQQQPIIYVDYPIASDLFEPQYVYIFK
ncbi:hypothetical protein PVAND_011932 [Polypedilum vanderplanki]|uniref:DUF4794 domain-containing protein n=1 Tax=Polypedilum vanderplanki TaxID=319348 RepID=A0A9J6CLR7_POLVA|nr:hypothetical protein PVAND_011932 [Polypedilum vanderplanki]